MGQDIASCSYVSYSAHTTYNRPSLDREEEEDENQIYIVYWTAIAFRNPILLWLRIT